ncbi:Wzz/FepE/Etk N-terminal domain-containing protein [Algoriphagus marinus]|uniref:Wzz/FepE/Etk N-terminal domain-containing protein n=1 Tax=Algoriphagus marinus TaxID=1925762 RepID=UPI00094B9221|nr:Wzz/FepE/Etk N-terminal domain-containing protein [Algoriphagus marinus]
MSENTSKISFAEIDLISLAIIVWKKRKVVLMITFAFAFLGIVTALIAPKEFSATATFIPQMDESAKSGASLGGLASLAGFNLGGMAGGSDISPVLYPKIVSSISFQKALLDAKIHVNGFDSTMTYQEYYKEVQTPGVLELIQKYTIGLPGILLKSLKGETEIEVNQEEIGILKVSPEEYSHFKRISSQLKIVPNEKEGIVSVYFKMPEPLMAAEMAKFAVDLLQKEIIQFKIKNAKEQLRFVEERFLERKKDFEEAQEKLAYFKDRNQNLNSEYAINQLQRLETNYNFYFEVYSELAKQVEQAKLQVAKNTPVFSIIQPVSVPLEKSNLRGSVILVIFMMIGIFFSIAYIIGVEFFNRLKSN